MRVEPLIIRLPTAEFETDRLRLAVNAHPAVLPSTSARLTLVEFQGRWKYEGFKITSSEPIYQYQAERYQFRRRHGLSGDVIYMLTSLLEPHYWEIEQAFSCDVSKSSAIIATVKTYPERRPTGRRFLLLFSASKPHREENLAK